MAKRQRYQATYAPRHKRPGETEFYSGITVGERVLVEVRESGTPGIKFYSVQSLTRPGAWLSVQPEDLIQ